MTHVVALAGNPNSGKTTVFNRLTGLNQRVGNYPGITVERRAGMMRLFDRPAQLIDLPGTYSLISRSRDEAVAFEVLTGRTSEKRPELVVIVLDASNLDRNLYLALSILELGIPAVIALNMIDLAGELGLTPDPVALAKQLGVPVVPIVAKDGTGIDALRSAIEDALKSPNKALPTPRRWKMTDAEEAAIARVRDAVHDRSNGVPLSTDGEAIWLLTTLAVADRMQPEHAEDDPLSRERSELTHALALAREGLAGAGHDFPARVIESRYKVATEIAEAALTRKSAATRTITDRLDAVLLHPAFGALIFVGVMALLFQSIFAWAEPMMQLIEGSVAAIQDAARAILPAGVLTDLVSDGVIGGVGNVIVFVPQIAILFAFIAILEDSGYLARAAFITDRLMARVGLHGRAFVPLLSGFACAVPAIMATRTIESKKDRLVTILVTPLMSCSARLPVYGLIISSLFSGYDDVFGVLSFGGLLMLAMYGLSVFTTIAAAFIMKRTILKSPTPPFVLELPPYRMPVWSSVLRRVYERCFVFVRDAGTIILACSIVLWALLYFPRQPEGTPQAAAVEESYAGRMGHAIEPAIAPLGFDWKIGIGLVASFAARETIVSTLGLIYGVGTDADEESVPLREALRREVHRGSGLPVYTPLVGLALMVFFVLACQCMSTLAVVRRETGTWRWPIFLFGYMTVLAWVGAFVVYQGGRLLGFS
jgi:ferrous iron transport protein B